MSTKRPFFRYSPWDALPALCGVAQVAFLLGTFLASPTLPWGALVPPSWSWPSPTAGTCSCISHNFIHNPYFSSAWLNRAYGVLESFAIGMPHQLYHHYHLNHHAGDNDAKGPDGTTRDWSSTYRYGKGDQPEPFWRYCLLSFWRVEVGPVLRVAVRHGRANVLQVLAETLALAAFWVVMALVVRRYFLFFYLPSFYLGWTLSTPRATWNITAPSPATLSPTPSAPTTASTTSCGSTTATTRSTTGTPRRHWTRMPQLHQKIRPHLEANGTKVLRGPHLTGLIEDFLAGPSQRRPGPAEEEAPRRAA